jgi:hypothetical protein
VWAECGVSAGYVAALLGDAMSVVIAHVNLWTRVMNNIRVNKLVMR